jgi:hypothetical protein
MRDRFSIEEACRSYLVELRWPNGIICPACGSKEIWIKKPPLNRCASCRYDFSVTAGTLFADTHKPLSEALVRSHLGCDEPEIRCQCLGSSADIGLGELPDRLELAA